MAAPLKNAKQTVNLASGEVRVSRIRRDPPPPKLKQISIEERNERDQRRAVIGITAFTVAIMVILFAVSSWSGWSLKDYTIYL